MAKRQLFQKIGKTRVIPIYLKILVVFGTLLLLASFTTNYINMRLNRSELIGLKNEILVTQLKDIYSNAVNQFNIFSLTGNKENAFESIIIAAQKEFDYEESLSFGLIPDGRILFQAGAEFPMQEFSDKEALQKLNSDFENKKIEGSFYFYLEAGRFLGVYRYEPEWGCYIVRAELVSEMTATTTQVFIKVSIIIVIITLIFLILGFYLFKKMLGYIGKITEQLYDMQKTQALGILDLDGAANDDVAFLGVSFNSLSSTINNLLHIFQKFASQDVVEKAYSERQIRLEGTQQELVILFSDICGFTYMTEVLGNDIINILNIHYSSTIAEVHKREGVVGSIIGDALLAVYGALKSPKNKTHEALDSAWGIIDVTNVLRKKMEQRRIEIEKERVLTTSEERVFKAVLLDVGVGLDGGNVFYGNIGSIERMTNTVIGDNVNSAARLEGLTRVYKVPVIVSEYIKSEMQKEISLYRFIEIDTVQVKGKTIGQKIYYPLDKHRHSVAESDKFELFSKGLQSYYTGDWRTAKKYMRDSNLPVTDIFLERMGYKSLAPEDWSGIWTMTTK